MSIVTDPRDTAKKREKARKMMRSKSRQR
jgi:hypothetical protein